MPDRVAEHYDRHAHAFDEARRAGFAERNWLDRFLLAVPRGGHILDLGCGGGEPVSRYLIDSGRKLTGVDVSGRMIALARTRFPRQDWLHEDMRTVVPWHRFHGILAWDSLFHLPPDDQAAMIAKFGEWLEPHGVLLFTTGPAHGEGAGCQFGDALYHASLDPAAYRDLLRQAGLAVIAFAQEDAASGGHTVWLAHKER
ncbi:class I SAM-dependent DNA methyltransferase [Sphingomonas canadensis]|uniref:Class I SAM-dependent DNA methyltransferase n=1 Tax=Sphingomonas canadensis TaxID=1219257 RepID=A0ABW3HAE5_9SPHN|nr:class I SAM-dependent methyltransferase [Sphingomonas canadensis]MCW3836122.1 methyltransferase domain-containing protein [Sphingomonas canadensis]